MSDITVFLPCRKGSQRVKEKNTREFSGISGGITSIKIKQLINTPSIDKIIVSTDDEKVKAICSKELKGSNKKYEILDRPEELAHSSTSTDDVIKHVCDIVSDHSSHILWTHVTSPFIDELIYEDAINKYKEILNQGYDSLMTVTKIQKYLWNEKGETVNYDRNIEKWPPTQSLPNLYELNSAIFIANIEIYKQYFDRIGKNPFLYITDEVKSRDIDWEEDFSSAESQWQSMFSN